MTQRIYEDLHGIGTRGGRPRRFVHTANAELFREIKPDGMLYQAPCGSRGSKRRQIEYRSRTTHSCAQVRIFEVRNVEHLQVGEGSVPAVRRQDKVILEDDPDRVERGRRRLGQVEVMR